MPNENPIEVNENERRMKRIEEGEEEKEERGRMCKTFKVCIITPVVCYEI